MGPDLPFPGMLGFEFPGGDQYSPILILRRGPPFHSGTGHLESAADPRPRAPPPRDAPSGGHVASHRLAIISRVPTTPSLLVIC